MLRIWINWFCQLVIALKRHLKTVTSGSLENIPMLTEILVPETLGINMLVESVIAIDGFSKALQKRVELRKYLADLK